MDKERKLRHILEAMTGGVAVAFSGGVDSTYLLHAALAALGPEKVLAVTVDSEVHPRREVEEAGRLARFLGARHRCLQASYLEETALRTNAPDRCYHCKKAMGEALLRLAAREGLDGVVDGANADDLQDYRPGSRAAAELGIRSPLQEAGFSKEDIRQASRALHLPTWSKPALACLATRFPYGEEITAAKLAQVEGVEGELLALGFTQVRVRHHGTVARLEVLPREQQKALDQAEALQDLCRRAGFTYAALDLGGYRQGSMQESEDFF